MSFAIWHFISAIKVRFCLVVWVPFHSIPSRCFHSITQFKKLYIIYYDHYDLFRLIIIHPVYIELAHWTDTKASMEWINIQNCMHVHQISSVNFNRACQAHVATCQRLIYNGLAIPAGVSYRWLRVKRAQYSARASMNEIFALRGLYRSSR